MGDKIKPCKSGAPEGLLLIKESDMKCMKTLILCCLLFAGLGLGGCMAKTTARLTYTAEGMPDITFFDNKTRNGVKLEVVPQGKGEAPKIIYSVQSSDANAVALAAVGLAKEVLNTSATLGGAVIGLPQ